MSFHPKHKGPVCLQEDKLKHVLPTHHERPSDRHFGLVFTLLFAVVGLWPLRVGGHVRQPWLILGGAFLTVTLFRPRTLHTLNLAWAKLGQAMEHVMNPVVMALLFFLVFTPAGVISRWLGKDPLRLKSSPSDKTYWIARQPPGPPPESMLKQF